MSYFIYLLFFTIKWGYGIIFHERTKEVNNMNQILSTSNTTTKKNKGKMNGGPADIKTVVRVFAIVMIIFGIFIIGTGSYAIYKDNENKNSEVTKPVITETLNEDNRALTLTVTHDEAIDRIEYSWNDGEIQTITGNGRKYIEQEIEIPGGVNTLHVKAVDIQGQEISTDKEYTAEEIINLSISGSKLKITAENETEISYMTYRWDDEEEQRIDINATTVDQEIDIPMGEHNLTVILVDINNKTITKEQKVKGVTKPTIEIRLDEAKESYLITITDETGLEKVDFIIRGEQRTITVDDGKKELKYRLQLNTGDENRLEITAYNIDGIASDTTKVRAKK